MIVVVNESEYRISYSVRDGYRAHMLIHNKSVFVTSARTRTELESKLNDEPQPRWVDPKDKLQRITSVDKKVIDGINKGRRLNGLSEMTISVKTCLKCRDSFETTGNRICGICRSMKVFKNTGSLQGRDLIQY